MRALVDHVETQGDTPLQVQGVSAAGTWGANLTVREVAGKCASVRAAEQSPFDHRFATPCPLDDPKVTWEVGKRISVPDGSKIARITLAAGLATSLIYGNYECFGPGCGTGAKVAGGGGDAVVGLSLVGFAVILVGVAVIAGHD